MNIAYKHRPTTNCSDAGYADSFEIITYHKRYLFHEIKSRIYSKSNILHGCGRSEYITATQDTAKQN
jgi:hypothetical protein